jgi:hypothetical protein
MFDEEPSNIVVDVPCEPTRHIQSAVLLAFVKLTVKLIRLKADPPLSPYQLNFAAEFVLDAFIFRLFPISVNIPGDVEDPETTRTVPVGGFGKKPGEVLLYVVIDDALVPVNVVWPFPVPALKSTNISDFSPHIQSACPKEAIVNKQLIKVSNCFFMLIIG